MVEQARSRNRRAIASGRVDLRRGSACALPFPDGDLDVVFSINAVQFWEDLRVGLCEIHRVLRPGGRIAIAIQPRNRGATITDAERWEQRLLEGMRAVGFEQLVAHRSEGDAVPTVCVSGRTPVAPAGV